MYTFPAIDLVRVIYTKLFCGFLCIIAINSEGNPFVFYFESIAFMITRLEKHEEFIKYLF